MFLRATNIPIKTRTKRKKMVPKKIKNTHQQPLFEEPDNCEPGN
jgi:hypothetical protein